VCVNVQIKISGKGTVVLEELSTVKENVLSDNAHVFN
jgi:hypothetical protein